MCDTQQYGLHVSTTSLCASKQGAHGARTVADMEQDCLQALSLYYFEGKPLLTNKEYDSLKEQLLLSGSKMPTLSKDELVFLQATRAYCMGQPVMADNDYNILKAKLKQRSSVVTAEGPRCSIRSRRMYADCRPDNLRQQLLSAPFVVALLSLMTAADSLVDFDKLMDVPMAGTLMWGILLPIVLGTASLLTHVLFKGSLVLKGPCPNCMTNNSTYFGEVVMAAAGNHGQNTVACTSCGAGLTFDRDKRIIVVNQTPDVRQRKRA